MLYDPDKSNSPSKKNLRLLLDYIRNLFRVPTTPTMDNQMILANLQASLFLPTCIALELVYIDFFLIVKLTNSDHRQ